MMTTLETRPVAQSKPVLAGQSPKQPRSRAIWDSRIVRGALLDSILKLNPKHMMRNPVMFVVEIGSVITTALLFKGGAAFWFNLQITLWLWFTVLFANFAEAMAEGRGKAQADTLRKARAETVASRILPDGRTEKCASAKLRCGDMVMVSAGDFIPRHARAVRLDQSADYVESRRDLS